MTIEFKPTKRGVLVGEFTDRFGSECSIQESSYPEERCLWLGVEVTGTGEPVLEGRMHLTREHARQLSEILRYFAEEGSLGVYSAEDYPIGQWVIGVGKDNHDVLGRVVEVLPHSHLVIQDDRYPGDKGSWRCEWDRVPRTWIPTEKPPEGRTFYELLGEDD